MAHAGPQAPLEPPKQLFKRRLLGIFAAAD
jgi:hypothetical protein